LKKWYHSALNGLGPPRRPSARSVSFAQRCAGGGLPDGAGSALLSFKSLAIWLRLGGSAWQNQAKTNKNQRKFVTRLRHRIAAQGAFFAFRGRQNRCLALLIALVSGFSGAAYSQGVVPDAGRQYRR
jgi:hypothetical protein